MKETTVNPDLKLCVATAQRNHIFFCVLFPSYDQRPFLKTSDMSNCQSTKPQACLLSICWLHRLDCSRTSPSSFLIMTLTSAWHAAVRPAISRFSETFTEGYDPIIELQPVSSQRRRRGGETVPEFLIISKTKWVKTNKTDPKLEYSWVSSCKLGCYKCTLKEGD